MATKFLRKIILEELQKVLKEEGAKVAGKGYSGAETLTKEPTKFVGYSDSLTRQQKAEIQKMMDDSGGTMSREEATQKFLAKTKSDLALSDLSGFERLEKMRSPTRREVIDLQTQLAKVGLLKKDQIDGKYGPITQKAVGLVIPPSMSKKELSKLNAADLSAVTSDLETKTPLEIAQLKKTFGTKTSADKVAKTVPAVSEKPVSATGSSPLSPSGTGRKEQEINVKLANPVTGKPYEEETPEQKEERLKQQDDLRKKGFEIQKKASDIKGESIVREINKLLRSL